MKTVSSSPEELDEVRDGRRFAEPAEHLYRTLHRGIAAALIEQGKNRRYGRLSYGGQRFRRRRGNALIGKRCHERSNRRRITDLPEGCRGLAAHTAVIIVECSDQRFDRCAAHQGDLRPLLP